MVPCFQAYLLNKKFNKKHQDKNALVKKDITTNKRENVIYIKTKDYYT